MVSIFLIMHRENQKSSMQSFESQKKRDSLMHANSSYSSFLMHDWVATYDVRSAGAGSIDSVTPDSSHCSRAIENRGE